MTLTEFLQARIAEDEAEAEAVAEGRYSAEEIGYPMNDAERRVTIRLARECEAKRRIVEAHPLVPAHDVWGREEEGVACEVCDFEADLTLGGYELGATGGCLTLRAVAAVYADHPDYRTEWRI